MSTGQLPPRQQRQKGGPRPWRFTKKQYYRLGELGFFTGRRVELLEGELVVLSPQNAAHTSSVEAVAEALLSVFDATYWVRRQFPLDLGQTTESEPDVSVVVGTRAQFPTAHPTSAVLIVEVSDSRLSYDRRRKGSLYARAGIPDYWIVNLVDRRLEVYRSPVVDASQRYGHRYSSRQDYFPGTQTTVSPLALPGGASVAVDGLFS